MLFLLVILYIDIETEKINIRISICQNMRKKNCEFDFNFEYFFSVFAQVKTVCICSKRDLHLREECYFLSPNQSFFPMSRKRYFVVSKLSTISQREHLVIRYACKRIAESEVTKMLYIIVGYNVAEFRINNQSSLNFVEFNDSIYKNFELIYRTAN
jgi:hypothetical protein